MKFIVSPAKKMVPADDSFGYEALPAFMSATEAICEALKALSYDELKALWKCSDAIAELNYERLQNMNLYQHVTPALFTYEGIQYQNMAPMVLNDKQLQYVQNHLRILSGFYGVLKPFDGITPYRLEMQTKLSVDGSRDLYKYWGSKLCDFLAAEDGVIVNLASVEYSKVVTPYVKNHPGLRVVTCLFGTEKNGKLVQRSTEAKAARGTFVRWCAEQGVEDAEGMKVFNSMGYTYREDLSNADTFVFIHE